MTYQRLGGVSRRCFVRALRAGEVETRTRGGEIVIVYPGRHRRLGGRRGVGPLLLERLLNELAVGGGAADEVREHLRGKSARRRAERLDRPSDTLPLNSQEPRHRHEDNSGQRDQTKGRKR